MKYKLGQKVKVKEREGIPEFLRGKEFTKIGHNESQEPCPCCGEVNVNLISGEPGTGWCSDDDLEPLKGPSLN